MATSSSTGTPVTVSVTVSEEGNYLANIDFTNPLGHYNCADITWQFLVDGKQQGENETCNSCGSSSISRYVKFSECGEDAPECDGEPEAPEIELNAIYQNGDFGINGCSSKKKPFGYFSPLIFDKQKANTYEGFDIDVCFNSAQQKWQTSVNGGKIQIKAILDICEQTMYAETNTVIENIDDVSNKINSTNACEAMRYFFSHMSYPAFSKYVIREFVEQHELAHADSFRVDIKSAQNIHFNYNGNNYPNYKDMINSFPKDCTEYRNKEEAKSKAKELIDKANDILRQNLIALSRERLRDKNDFDIPIEEDEINRSLIPLIVTYQDKIIELFPEIRDTDCYNYYLGGF